MPGQSSVVVSFVLALALTLGAGCNDNGSANGGGGGGPGQQPGTAPSVAPVPPQGTAPSLRTTTSAACEHIADLQGRSLYYFQPDSATQSTCNDSCAAAWPPMIASSAATPVALPPARQDLTGFPITRYDGRLQDVYSGHPLYTYTGDSGPGETKGHCVTANGGSWFLMKADGTPCSCDGGGGGGSGGSTPNDCGTYEVCGWTPGWRCWNNHQGRSSCCWNANDSFCKGSSCNYYCKSGAYDANCYSDSCGWSWCSSCSNSSGGGSCGTYEVCGWTPGWHCWNNHQGRSSCCWDAYDSNCKGY